MNAFTLLKADPTHRRLFVGEAGDNTLRIFDWNRRPISSLKLASPPTDLIVDGDHVLVLESGILDPNDEPKGALVQYDFPGADSLRSPKVVIDSLFRPVFVEQFGLRRLDEVRDENLEAARQIGTTVGASLFISTTDPITSVRSWIPVRARSAWKSAT